MDAVKAVLRGKFISLNAYIRKHLYYSAIKKKLAICDNVDESRVYHANEIKSERDKYCMIPLIYGI